MKIDKLEIHNSNLTKVFQQGKRMMVAAGLSLALSGCAMNGSKNDVDTNVEMTSMLTDLEMTTAFSVSSEELNDLHLVLCNNRCNQEMFDATVSKLQDLGVTFQTALPGDDVLREENATIVTMAGVIYDSDSCVILGQYNNNVTNNSDILALAMRAGLQNQDVTVDAIRAGVTQIDQEAGITRRVPTATEAQLAPSSSFVAVAIGNQIHPREKDAISDGIISGITRAAYEIKENPEADYLYRVSATDTLDGIALKMNSETDDLKAVNDCLRQDFIPVYEIIFRPGISRVDAFKKNIDFDVQKTNTTAKIN